MPLVPTVLGPLFVDDQGSTHEPTALLWPSLFTDHRMWRGQIPALRDAGWRTLALDPPSHGQSPGPGRPFTMDECAEAALQVLDAVGVRMPVVVLGTSWGGFVAPRIALRAPDRVRGMVLFNTSAQQPMPSQRAKATLLVKLMGLPFLDGLVDRINLSTLLAPDTRRRQPQLGAELVAHYRSWNRRRLVLTVRSVLLERSAVLDALPRLLVPSLVVSGGQDTILPAKLGQTLAGKLPAARYVEVPAAAHLIPLEAPETANTLILGFLRETSSVTPEKP